MDVKVQKKVGASGLTRAQRYKVGTATRYAYVAFMMNPKTDRSIDNFLSDIDLALNKITVNATVPGDTKPRRISIDVPQKFETPLEMGGTELKPEYILPSEIKSHFMNDITNIW
jgi:hypothetical protein